MRKIKVIKDKTLTKYGYVNVEDVELPIKFCGLKRASVSASKLAEMYKIPTKTRPATLEEIDKLKAEGYEIGKVNPMIKEFDLTSKEYVRLEEDKNETLMFLEMAIHVDLKYMVEDEEGKEVPFWKSIGIKDEFDTIGCAKWLAGLDLSANKYKYLMNSINHIEYLGAPSYELFEQKSEVAEDESESETEEKESISV